MMYIDKNSSGNYVTFPKLTKKQAEQMVQTARKEVIKNIEQTNYQETVNVLKANGLCAGLIVKYGQAEQKKVLKKEDYKYVLMNQAFDYVKLDDSYYFLDLGLENKTLFLQTILYTLPKKYTGQSKYNTIESVIDFYLKRVNEQIDILNNTK